jgi:retron-type reverse transcriptase
MPKANGKVRTLTITAPRDKMVIKAIWVILEAIYEPLLKRPNKSTHDVLHKRSTGYS